MSSTDDPADIVISTFAERPAYVDRVYEMADDWPTFLLHDRVAKRPRIAAYLASDRRIAFSQWGIYRYFKDLDA